MRTERGQRQQATRSLFARWAPVVFLAAVLVAMFFWQPTGAGSAFANESSCDPRSRQGAQCAGEASPAGERPGKKSSGDSASGGQEFFATEQVDLYGVVVDVKNAGPLKSNGKLLKPIQQQEIIQKVTVRLDMQSRIKGLKDLTVTVDNVVGENPAFNIPVKPGARVLLNMERNPDTGQWMFHIANRARTPALMILASVLILAVLIIGGPEVSKHMLLSALMLIGVYKALFPAVLLGRGGMLWILLMCFMFTILGSFIYQVPGTRALSREQSVVVLGTLGGLLIMGLIMWVMHLIAPLDGYSSEGLADLWYQSRHMDFWALFMASILIGYQGFLFYLCWQLAQNRKQEGEVLDFGQRFAIVMLRGRRLLGPLLSSLFLLFIGLYLPILLQMQGTPTAQFMNLEAIASMLAYAFAGGLTLILTVPLTALIAAWRLSPVKPKALTPTEP
jgi:uncharacterized membrane protein